MLILENTLLLTTGLLLGIVSAGVALLPHVVLEGAKVPLLAMGELLLIVLVVGLSVGLFFVRQMLKVAPIAALRGE